MTESFADSALLPDHDAYSQPVVMSGVPVDEYCLAELAAALRTSQGAARARTEQSLEVRERLPRLWVKVHTGVLPAWRAREVARETLSLSDEAADYVDRQLSLSGQTVKPFTVYDLSWQTQLGEVLLQLNVKNLTDKVYAVSGFTDRTGSFPGEPRRVYLQAIWRF